MVQPKFETKIRDENQSQSSM